jgi:hypothetical protein
MVVLLGLVGLGAPPAHAADGTNQAPPPGSGQYLESWALAPTGVDPSQPSSRAYLSYSLAPGATTTDSVSLWNYSDVQLTFHVYATDAFNNHTGQFSLLPGDQKPTDAGTWVTLQTNSVTVPSKTRVDIPVTVHVPADASPGDHTAGVIASLPTGTTSPSGQPLVVDRRTGSRVYVRVSGPVNPALRVENLSSEYHGQFNPLDGSLDVSYTVRNAGNIRMAARQKVEVHDIFGRTVAKQKLPDIADALPGSTFVVRHTFTGVPAGVRLTTDVTITPVAAQGATEKPIAAHEWTTTTWAIPWTLLLLVALALLLWRLVRRYRGRRGAAPLAPGGGSPRPGTTPTGGGGPQRAPQPVSRFTRPQPGASASP